MNATKQPSPYQRLATMLTIPEQHRREGYETLIRAAAKLDIPFVIAGDGPQAELDRLNALIQSAGASNIKWVGPQSASAVRDYMRGSKFVIVPSEWYDNFPAVIREAYAVGKPVIASRIGWIGCGRNWCAKPRSSRMSPTTGVYSSLRTSANKSESVFHSAMAKGGRDGRR